MPGQDPAAKVLVGRLLDHVACWAWFPARRQPYRLSSCGDFYPHTETLLRVLDAHREYADCAAVLVLFDLDDGNPCDVGPEVAARIRAHQERRGAWPFSIVVVCAHREYESWFLASLVSIKNTVYPAPPEGIRDAKGWLERHFGYREVSDQATYTRSLDIYETCCCSRSFRRLHHAFQQLAVACQSKTPIITP